MYTHNSNLVARSTAPPGFTNISLGPYVTRVAGETPRTARLDVDVDGACGARHELCLDLPILLDDWRRRCTKSSEV